MATKAVEELRRAVLDDGGDESLDAFEARCRRGKSVTTLLETYTELTERAQTSEQLTRMTRRVARYLAGLINAEPLIGVRAELRKRRGVLLARLGNIDDAVAEWCEAFRELPDEEVLRGLGALINLQADADLEAAVLQARVALSEDAERRIEAARRLGAVQVSRQRLREAEAQFELVLEVSPDDPTAREALQRIQEIRQGREAMLAAMRDEVDTAETAADRTAALVALAEGLLELDADSPEAVEVLERAIASDPEHSDSVRLLVGLYSEIGDWQRIREITATWIKGVDDADKFDALKLAGMTLLSQPEQQSIAIEYLISAAQLRASDTHVVDALDAAMTASEQFEPLVEILQKARRASSVRGDERRWLVREAEILWHIQDDLTAAERMFRRVRAVDPRNLTALLFYEDYLRRNQDWKRLYAVYAQKLTLVAPHERVDVACNMADIAENELGNLDKAIEAFKRVVNEFPDDDRALEALEALYRKAHKWHALIEHLNGRVRRLPPEQVDNKVALLFQIIEIYQDPDRLPVEEMVIHTYNRVVQLSPANVEALDSLARRYETTRRWSELVDVLQKKIEATSDAEELLDLFHQCADLYISRMSSESQAIPFLERILEIDPSNLAVVHSLRRIYKAKHNIERLYTTYEAELELLEGVEREPVLLELATLAADKFQRFEEAVGYWEEIHALNPKSEQAAEALEKLYAQLGYWDRSADLLLARLDSSRSKRRRIDLLMRLGEVYHTRLKQLDAARDTYIRALELNPDHAECRTALQQVYVTDQDWDALAALYSAHGDWRGYLGYLDQSYEREDDVILRSELQLEAARILEEYLEDNDGAVARLESIVSEDTQNVKAAELLDARYAALDQSDKRIAVLAVVADNSDEPEKVLAALNTTVELLRELGHHSVAFDTAGKAAILALEDGNFDGPSHLETLAEAADRLDDLVSWYTNAADLVHDVALKRELLTAQAELLTHRLARNDEAITVYEELFDLDPDDTSVLQTLELLTYSQEDWGAFERVILRQIDALRVSDVADSQQQLRACFLKLGELYEDIVEDPARSVANYREALEVNPGDPDAVAGLDRVCRREGMWDDLVTLLEGQLAELDDPSAIADHKSRLANVFYEHLENVDEALVCLEDALAASSVHPGAIGLLGTLFDADHERERVGLMLEPCLRETEQYEQLVRVLVDRLSRTDDPMERHALLGDVAFIRESHLNHPAGAFKLLREQFALAPGDSDVRENLERLAPGVNGWADVTDLYLAATGHDSSPLPSVDVDVEVLEDAVDAGAVLRRAGEISELELGDLGQAVRCFDRAREFEPESLELIEVLERLHDQRKDWDALLEIYRTKVDLVWDVDQRKAIYSDICLLLCEEMGRESDAIEYYRALFELDEQDTSVASQLAALYRKFEQWDDLVMLLESQGPRVDSDEERVANKTQIAEIMYHHLEDHDGAVAHLESAVALIPADAGATSLLNQLFDDGIERERVGFLLEPALREQEQHTRLMDVLVDRITRTDIVDEKRAILGDAARIQEQFLNDNESAFRLLAQQVAVVPQELDVRENYERLAQGLGHWNDVVRMYTALAGYGTMTLPSGHDVEATDDPDVMCTLLMRAAQINEQELDDLDRAVLCCEQAQVLKPEDIQLLDELARLQRHRQAWEPLLDVLVTKAGLVYEVDEKKAANNAICELLRGALNQSEDSIPYYQETLELDESDDEVASELDSLLAEHERWDDLVVLLESRLHREGSDDVVVVRRHRVAEVLYRHANSPESAVHHLEQAVETIADYLPSITLLNEIFDAGYERDRIGLLLEPSLRDDASYDRLAAVLSDRLTRCQPGQETEDILKALYEIRTEHLSDSAGAFAVATEQVAQFPDNLDYRQQFERLASEQNQWSTVTELYSAIAGSGDFDSPLGCEHGVQTIDDPEQLSILMQRAASIHLSEHNDLDQAAMFYERAYECQPEDLKILDSLLSVHRDRSDWDMLLETYRSKADLVWDPDQKKQLFLEMSSLLSGELNRAEDAIDCYRDALDIDESDVSVLVELESLYRKFGRWEDLVDLLRRRLGITEDSADRVAIHMALGHVLADELDDTTQAVESFARALIDAPETRDAVDALQTLLDDRASDDISDYIRRTAEILEPWYEQRELWELQVGVIDVKVTLAADDLEQATHLERKARLLEQSGSQPADLFSVYKQILVLDARNVAAFDALDRLSSVLNNWIDWVALLEEAAQTDDMSVATRLLSRAGLVAESQLHDVSRAIEIHERVLELDPADRDSLAALDRLFSAEGRMDDRVSIVEREAELAETDGHRRQLMYEAAKLHEALEHNDEAIEALNYVVSHGDLAGEPLAQDAADALEKLFEIEAQWDRLADLLLLRAETTSDVAISKGYLIRAGNAFEEHLQRYKDAINAYERARTLDPKDATVFETLCRLLTDAQRWDDLELLYLDVRAHAEGDDEANRYDSLLAELYRESMSRPMDSLDRYEAILGRSPNHESALQALDSLIEDDELGLRASDIVVGAYSRLDQPERLAEALSRRLTRWRDDIDVSTANIEIAALEEAQGRRAEAIERYNEALAYDDFNTQAYASLERLLTAETRWEDLAELLERASDIASGDEAKAIRMRLANVYLERLDNAQEALVIYRDLVTEAPDDHAVAHALTVLARNRSDLRDSVAEILEPVHKEAGRWDEVISMELLRVAEEDSDASRASVYRTVAEIYEDHLNDPNQAFDYFVKAITSDASLAYLVSEADRLAGSLERFDDLMSLYEQLVNASESDEFKRDLLVKAGSIARDHLTRLEDAEEYFNRALAIDSEHFPALDGLERLFHSQGRMDAVIQICERKAALPIEVPERIALYRKIAKAATRRGKPGRAEESWRWLLRLDSTDMEALESLEAIYRVKGDYDNLANVMELRSELLPADAVLVTLKLELGRILHEELSDTRGAADAYQEVIELEPGNVEALNALEILYEKLGDVAKLSQILDVKLSSAPDTKVRLDTLIQLATVADKMGDVDEAVERYEDALTVDPANEVALDELMRIYHKYERWEDLCRAYDRKLQQSRNSAEHTVLRLKAAETYISKLGDFESASGLVNVVLEGTPQNPNALRLRAQIDEAQGSESDAVAGYESLLPTLTNPRERVTVLVNLGKLYLNSGENERALEAFREAVSLDSENLEAGVQVKNVLRDMEDWTALVAVLEHEFNRAKGAQAVADSCYELGVLHRDQLNQPAESAHWLKVGYDARRDHRGIVEALITSHAAAQRWAEAIPLLGWLVSYLETKRQYTEVAEKAYELGVIYENVAEYDKALKNYKLSKKYDSRNIPNLLALGRLAYRAEDYDKAFQTLQGLLLLQHDIEDVATKVDMFLYLVRVCIALGDKAKARRHLDRLLALDPDNSDGLALQGKV